MLFITVSFLEYRVGGEKIWGGGGINEDNLV